LWVFVEQAAPVAGADWYLELIELGDRLDPQTLTDALANAAYLSVVHLARYQAGVELAERSLMVSDRGGVEQSPWSLLALTPAAFFSTHESNGLRLCEEALAAADARRDEFAAVVATGQLAGWFNLAGNAERGNRASMDAQDRHVHEASGAKSTRHQIRNLITHLHSIIDRADRADQ
jgi:hypothetical protein